MIELPLLMAALLVLLAWPENERRGCLIETRGVVSFAPLRGDAGR